MESLCCIPEINVMLYVSYTSVVIIKCQLALHRVNLCNPVNYKSVGLSEALLMPVCDGADSVCPWVCVMCMVLGFVVVVWLFVEVSGDYKRRKKVINSTNPPHSRNGESVAWPLYTSI